MRPGRDDAPAVAAARGIGDAEGVSVTASDLILPDADAARIAAAERDTRYKDLRARFALASFEFYVCDGNGQPVYFAARWTFTRRFDSLDDAGRFLRMVGEGRP